MQGQWESDGFLNKAEVPAVQFGPVSFCICIKRKGAVLLVAVAREGSAITG